MSTELRLDLPWLPDVPHQVDGLDIARDPSSRLTFDDGIELEVVLLHPSSDATVDAVIESVREASGPGRVVLVSGVVPVAWRAALRGAGISWLATDGRMELRWPRVQVSAHRVTIDAGTPVRRRDPVPLQKRQGVVAQELCSLAFQGDLPLSIGEIALRATVDEMIASSACDALARQGYVTKERVGRRVMVSVDDVVPLATLVRDRTGWPGATVVWAYGYGRSLLDVAARLTRTSRSEEVPLAVTGRVGAAFLGIIGTGEPAMLRVRAEATPDTIGDVLSSLGLDAVDRAAANIAIALDRWGLGTTNAEVCRRQGYEATVASPIRVWCDLADEPRGIDFAAELWQEMAHGSR